MNQTCVLHSLYCLCPVRASAREYGSPLALGGETASRYAPSSGQRSRAFCGRKL